MTLDQIMENLSKATPETLTQSIADAGGKIKDLLFQERTEAHNMSRAQTFEKVKSEIGAKFPAMFPAEGLSKFKYEDMIAKISEIKPAKIEPKEPTETAEQIKARFESEYQDKTTKLQNEMKLSAVRDQIKASAIARKLDEKYQPVFAALLESEFDIELNADKVFFKGKADGKYLTTNGEHGTATHAAEELLKRYPRLVTEAIKTPSATPNGTAGNVALVGKIRAGLSELNAFKSA